MGRNRVNSYDNARPNTAKVEKPCDEVVEYGIFNTIKDTKDPIRIYYVQAEAERAKDQINQRRIEDKSTGAFGLTLIKQRTVIYYEWE